MTIDGVAVNSVKSVEITKKCRDIGAVNIPRFS